MKTDYLLPFLFLLSIDICLNLFQIVLANQSSLPTLAKLNRVKLNAPKKQKNSEKIYFIMLEFLDVKNEL